MQDHGDVDLQIRTRRADRGQVRNRRVTSTGKGLPGGSRQFDNERQAHLLSMQGVADDDTI